MISIETVKFRLKLTVLIHAIFVPTIPRTVSDDLVGEERTFFDEFCKLAHAASGKHGDRPPNPYSLAHQCHLDLAKVNKDSPVGPAIWVAYMFIFAEVNLVLQN